MSGKLAGKVLFITGASRGIGRAIALRAARDGANIVIAAKTREPHPKLPGTIFTVAEEVEKAGGKSLPCVVDIRFEDQVQRAIDETIKRFGRLDILVNNASAISLTNTSSTPMKTYDLMNSINARGTYLCSKLCIPHLERSGPGSHILNLSPPLDMKTKWFDGHVAYAMAKFGMSMCVLGMASELRDKQIAVNALWPRYCVHTAAMELIGGGKAVAKRCRKPDIMADAAHLVLCQPASFSGNFLIDEDFLRSSGGVRDFDQYAISQGSALIPDLFVEPDDSSGADSSAFLATMEQKHKSAGAAASSSSSSSSPVQDTFRKMEGMLGPDAVKAVGARFAFTLTGKEPGTWFLDLKTGTGSVGQLDPGRVKEFEVQLFLSSDTLIDIFGGKMSPTKAFMSGDLKIVGNAFLAMKLETLINRNL